VWDAQGSKLDRETGTSGSRFYGLPRTDGFSRCDYRAAQMKHTIAYAHGRLFNNGDENRSMFLFKGDTFVD